jgi:ankyrin repeat protein
MPRGLEGAFKATVDRIKCQAPAASDQGMNILQWVFLATRQLTVEELRHALAVNEEDTEIDWESFTPTSSLLGFCLGLVIVDEGTSTLRLVHKSLHDYLQSEYNRQNLFKDGHSEIALICLTYMKFNFSSNSEDLNSLDLAESDVMPQEQHSAEHQMKLGRTIIQRYVFLDYAICNWCYHTKKTVCTKVRDLGIDLLLDDSNFRCISQNLRTWPISIAWYLAQSYGIAAPIKHLFDRHESTIRASLWETSTVSALHIAAYYGIESIARELIDKYSVDINAEFRLAVSPLLIASLSDQDNSKIFHLLGRSEIKVNQQCANGYTTLIRAAKNGNTDLARLLLQRSDTDIALPNRFGFTALMSTAQSGHTGIVRLLLQRADIDINAVQSKNGFSTALTWAVEKRHANVIRLLLERNELKVNLRTASMDAALTWATEETHTDIVRHILERNKRKTSLQITESSRIINYIIKTKIDIIRLLLEHASINVDLQVPESDHGRILLKWAVDNRHMDIAKSIVEQNTIDNLGNQYANMILVVLAQKGHEDLIRFFLDENENEINVNSQDGQGDTALMHAARGGYSRIVSLLLQRADIEVNKHNKHGDTALFYAFERGHSDVICLFLSRNDIDVNKHNKHGDTALFCALKRGHSDIISPLLRRADIDVNKHKKHRSRDTALFRPSEQVLSDIISLPLPSI